MAGWSRRAGTDRCPRPKGTFGMPDEELGRRGGEGTTCSFAGGSKGNQIALAVGYGVGLA